MDTHLKIIGCTLIALSAIHIIFPSYFNWREELGRLSLINRQMMQIHTLFVALMVFFIGLLCVSSTDQLISTELGHRICLGLAIFWLIRLIVQFIGYSRECNYKSVWLKK